MTLKTPKTNGKKYVRGREGGNVIMRSLGKKGCRNPSSTNPFSHGKQEKVTKMKKRKRNMSETF